MKKILVTIALFVSLVVSSLAFAAATSRPSNEWEFVFDDNERVVVTAYTIDEALCTFRAGHAEADIKGVARRSYIMMIWQWETAGSRIKNAARKQ